jgi:hypothetical protein
VPARAATEVGSGALSSADIKKSMSILLERRAGVSGATRKEKVRLSGLMLEVFLLFEMIGLPIGEEHAFKEDTEAGATFF